MTTEDTIILPTDKQIYRASLMGWTYIGDGLFERDECMGYFTDSGWEVESD